MYPVHEKKLFSDSYERLTLLWESHPQYRNLITGTRYLNIQGMLPYEGYD